MAGNGKNPFIYTKYVEGDNRITRKEVDEIQMHLDRGYYISVLAPRLCGKTTLLKQVEKINKDTQTVYVNFKGNICQNKEQVLQVFLQSLEKEGKEVKIAQPSSDMDYADFFTELEKEGKFIFLLDELPNSEALAFELLCGIRVYFNEGFTHPKFHQFVFASSIDLAQFSNEQNNFISPFNIAQTIYLDDFSEKEVQDFIEGKVGNMFDKNILRNDSKKTAIEVIFEYTEGHPYLTQYLCAYLYSRTDKIEEELQDVSKLVDNMGIEKEANVTSMVGGIKRHSDWAQLLKRILHDPEIPFTLSHKVVRELNLNGCIKGKDRYCVIRNPIYKVILDTYFKVDRSTESIFPLAPSKVWIIPLLQGNSDRSRIRPKENDEGESIYTLDTGKKYNFKVVIQKGEIEHTSEPESVEVKPSDPNNRDVELTVEIESFYDLQLYDLQVSSGKSKMFNLDLKELRQSFDFSIEGTEKTHKPVKVFINLYQDMLPIKVVKLLFEFN